MCAFRNAVEVGSDALETDVHLTSDGVVVLSHDATLKRCFGVDKKIADCDWEYISGLRTLREPHEPMPRLLDLVNYLAQPKLAHIWLLLDIKLDNKANEIMRCTAKVFEEVSAPFDTLWEDRVVLGCWAANYIPLCEAYFPGYPVVHIGFSVPYSSQFLAIENIGYIILQETLVSPLGRSFIRDARAAQRPILSWSVNDEKDLDWCVRRELDGVITDNPKKLLELRESSVKSGRPLVWSVRRIASVLRINMMIWVFNFIFGRKYGFGLDQRYTTKSH
ncbi:gamma-tubulin [Rhinocladiella similis]